MTYLFERAEPLVQISGSPLFGSGSILGVPQVRFGNACQRLLGRYER